MLTATGVIFLEDKCVKFGMRVRRFFVLVPNNTHKYHWTIVLNYKNAQNKLSDKKKSRFNY